MDLCDISDIKSLLRRHNFHFSKSMGQNFLVQSWVVQDIAAAAGIGPGVGVLEIGPGIGPLTRELSAQSERVVSIELDRALLPILADTLGDRENVEIIPGDALHVNLPALVAEKLPGLIPVACANLPYNITSPAISALIEAKCFHRITVMIQREVALRICARPGSRDYGAFSVFCQYHTQPELLFDVPNTCFIPAPKVTSSVVRLVPRPAPPIPAEDEVLFFRLVRGAFSQRRKTLLNSLSSAFASSHSKEVLAKAIFRCGLDADVRGERLGIPEFAALARIIREANIQ